MKKVKKVLEVGGSLMITIPRLVIDMNELKKGDLLCFHIEKAGTIELRKEVKNAKHK